MKILVTGANGFVGKNLVETLKCIRDGKKRDTDLEISDIYEYDLDSTAEDLDLFCRDCDFVFNLAGVNRPKEDSEFMTGNFGFASDLLETLKRNKNTCSVMLSSSIQASLKGRFGDSEYGRSKLAGEELFFSYAEETGAKVLVYRFPNLFGKWCRPNYNSAVATFCNAFANDLPYMVNDPMVELELLYIDDLVKEMLEALQGREHRGVYPVYPPHNGEQERENKTLFWEKGHLGLDRYDGTVPFEKKDGKYCFVPITFRVTLGRIVELLEGFKMQPESLLFTSIPEDSFEKRLYSTYLSYLPKEKTIFNLSGVTDERGAFIEFFRNKDVGQFSINVSKPGKTKGQHWHHTKMEIFLVVSGHGLIQERQIGIDPTTGEAYPIREFEVSGDKLQCVYMLPGYTHNIINLSDTEEMVTVMWANEIFDAGRPETYHEDVVSK